MRWWCLLLISAVISQQSSCASPPLPPSRLSDPPAETGSIEKVALRNTAPLPSGGELNKFFNRLALLQHGTGENVRIIQLGDSHTAADYFTGELRDSFQQQFGNAGVGTRAAGLPYVGVRQKDMTLSQTGRWQYHNSLKDHAFSSYGISGFAAESRSSGASLYLAATDPRGFDRGFVEFVRKPGGGTLQLWLDNVLVRNISTQGPAGTFGHVDFSAARGNAHGLKLVALSKGTTILSWNTERNDPGVVLDSFGIVSATAGIIAGWNPDIVRQELGALNPALVILAYGTNEGAHKSLDREAYEAAFGRILSEIRRWSPASSILIIEPTDGAHQSRDCVASASSPAACPWQTLPALDDVRRIQSRQAAIYGAAVWDSSLPELRTGGINRWAVLDPPLARPDHVHFTKGGYSLLADNLYQWFDNGFRAYKNAHSSNVSWP